MIRRIELKNFMSHRHTVVDLAEGLTVLVGENNCGKSAIVIALQVLSQNVSGDFMVRHGEKECSVKVETDDDHVLEWRRRGGSVSYCVDGREIDRLKGKVPEDLHDYLQMPIVESEDGTKFDIHFGEQKKPIFLLDETSSRRAVFFASSSDTARLLEMQNLHRQNIRDAKTEERFLSKKLTELAEENDRLSGVEQLESDLEKSAASFAAVEESAKSIQALRELSTRLKRCREQAQSLRQKSQALESLKAPPKLQPAAELRELIMRTRRLGQKANRDRALLAVTAEMGTLPKLDDSTTLLSTVSKLKAARILVVSARSKRSRVAKIPLPPELASTGELAKLCSRFRESVKDQRFREKAAAEAKAQQSQAEESLREAAVELQSCPTCGQALDPDKLVATAAGTPTKPGSDEGNFKLE
jgi:DNA repair exonuclease SbcCD ATPase subunit